MGNNAAIQNTKKNCLVCLASEYNVVGTCALTLGRVCDVALYHEDMVPSLYVVLLATCDGVNRRLIDKRVTTSHAYLTK